MVGSFVFAPSLFFSIRDKVKMPKATTLPTAVVLTNFVGLYLILGLYLAAVATILTATCWWILFATGRKK